MMNRMLATALFGTLCVVGCGGGSGSGGGSSGGSDVYLVEIVISPVQNTLQVSSVTTYAALGGYSDGSVAGVDVTWAVSDGNKASIDQAGNLLTIDLGVVQVTATSRWNAAVYGVGTLTIQAGPAGPPDIFLSTPVNGYVGSNYACQFTYTGGSGSPTWLVFSGSLPTGLTLDGPTGVVSGVPTTANTYSFTLQVSAGGMDTQDFSITITTGGSGGTGGGVKGGGKVFAEMGAAAGDAAF